VKVEPAGIGRVGTCPQERGTAVRVNHKSRKLQRQYSCVTNERVKRLTLNCMLMSMSMSRSMRSRSDRF